MEKKKLIEVLKNRARTTSVFIFVSVLFFSLNALAQQQITIVNTPTYYTPLLDDLYLSGNFNNWIANDPNYKFTKQPNGNFTLNLNLSAGYAAECKITRGTWPSVETLLNGNFLPNRTFTAQNSQSLNFDVANWEDMLGWHTALGNTHIVTLNFPIGNGFGNRRIWIYLPQDYYTSANDYPVLYLQDAQNLFDEVYTAFGTEWGIDEAMHILEDSAYTKAIIVGIDNGGANRINEYSPWVNAQYGGGQGEHYASFLVNNLKPYIDNNFRTLPSREFTGVGGSSMGGLISMYTLLEYQQVFSKALIFSPSFWFNDSCFTHAAASGFQQACKIYFLSGLNESATMVPKMNQMKNTLVAAGHSAIDMPVFVWADGQHSEWFWKREFPSGFKFLFQDNNPTKLIENKLPNNTNSPTLFYNSLQQKIEVKQSSAVVYDVQLFSADGKILSEGKIAQTIDLCLKPGIYFFRLFDERLQDYTGKIVVE
jgi:predicted alpha/beta superfamily hydrolase